MKPVTSDGAPAGKGVFGFTRFVRDVNPHVIDGLMALVLTAAALATVLGRSDGEGDFRGDDLLGGGLVLLQTVPLAARRFSPLGVLGAISAGVAVYSAAGYEVVQAGTFGSLIALYGAAALTDNRRGAIAAVISLGAMVAFFATNRGDWGLPNILTIGGTWAIAWFAGTFVRVRGEQAQAAGVRATRLELERDLRAREAVAGERARMARELHDIVGHALNVIVIQAGGAQRVFDARPEVSREVLASIESTGREALSEMERMLAVLTAVDWEEQPSGPQPGLAQLEALAAHVSEAGMQVQVAVEGERLEVPASVELSAYRIVQESLTNSLKHSGATMATVTIRYREADLEVEVVDNGRGFSARKTDVSIGGRGHLGMQERVAMFGGEISIGALPSEGGYRVWARLPFTNTTLA